MNPRTEPTVIVRSRMDQTVGLLGNDPIPHDHHPHRTDTRPLAIGRFEVYGGKISHAAKIIKKRDSPAENPVYIATNELFGGLNRLSAACGSRVALIAIGTGAFGFLSAASRSFGRLNGSLCLSCNCRLFGVSTAAHHRNGSKNNYEREDLFHHFKSLILDIYQRRKDTDSAGKCKKKIEYFSKGSCFSSKGLQRSTLRCGERLWERSHESVPSE